LLKKSVTRFSCSRKLFMLTAFVLILSTNTAKSIDSLKVKSSIGKDFNSDCKIFLKDGICFYSSPFRFTGKDWIYTGLTAGAIAGIMTLDEDVKNDVSVNNGNSQNAFWSVGKNYGSAAVSGTVSILVYSAGLFTHQNEIRITGRMLLQSLVYSGIITTIIKSVTGRSRPYITNNQYQFNWFETNNDELSFPSGHATTAFSMSTVLAERINTWWARIILYPLAAVTAYSRVRDDQHWLSDVVAGSLIGFGTGFFVVHKENEREQKHSSVFSKINFYPSLYGINLEYKF
jgi:PAP2 superfamily